MPRPLNFVQPDIAGYKALGHGGFGQVTPGDLANLPLVGPYTIGSAGGFIASSETTPLNYVPPAHSMIASPLTDPQIAALSYANQAYFGGSAMPTQSTAQAWFSANWEWLALGGLIVYYFILIGKKS